SLCRSWRATVVPAEPAPTISVLFFSAFGFIYQSRIILHEKRDPPINSICNIHVIKRTRTNACSVPTYWATPAVTIENVTALKIVSISPTLAYSHALWYNL